MSTPTAPTDDAVRTRAYHLWEAAGRPDCDGTEFWDAARRKLAAGDAPPALNGLLAAMSRPGGGDGLAVGASFSPGWEVRHERPGDALPPVRRFADTNTDSIDPAYRALVGGVDWASGPDRTVLSEVLVRGDAPPVMLRVEVLEPGDPSPPVGIFTSPPEVAGRLAKLATACKADEERLRKVLADRREARRARAALCESLADGPVFLPPNGFFVHDTPTSPPVPPPPPKQPTPEMEWAKAAIDPRHWDSFCRIVRDGAECPEFWAYLETDAAAKSAVGAVIDRTAEVFRTAIAEAFAEEAARHPSPPPSPPPPPEPESAVSWAWRNTMCRCGLHRWSDTGGGTFCYSCRRSRG